MKPDPKEIIAAIDDTDALLELASDALDESPRPKIQAAIATCLRAAKQRLNRIADELDTYMLEEEKAAAVARDAAAAFTDPIEVSDARRAEITAKIQDSIRHGQEVRSELAILDEINAINQALKQVGGRE
ncbi:hypothetical protein [Ferirhizobium litorale]|uniref:Uncharacterized protein n=1 Tax=Ferirhizobium litorale TaxID=2927786 RepID=A0AAE3QD36_9HYPH|nr:hypothetical protein [Fererhizobium litorale]MDI7921750.1 hypothetical protein [Fererhizobium litorale]